MAQKYLVNEDDIQIIGFEIPNCWMSICPVFMEKEFHFTVSGKMWIFNSETHVCRMNLNCQLIITVCFRSQADMEDGDGDTDMEVGRLLLSKTNLYQ